MNVKNLQLYLLVLLLNLGTDGLAQDPSPKPPDEVFAERSRLERNFHMERAREEENWHRERAQEVEELHLENPISSVATLRKIARRETVWYRDRDREAREHVRKLGKLDNEFHLQLAKVEAQWYGQRAEEAKQRAQNLRKQDKSTQNPFPEWHAARLEDQYNWHMDRAKRASEHWKLIKRAMTDL